MSKENETVLSKTIRGTFSTASTTVRIKCYKKLLSLLRCNVQQIYTQITFDLNDELNEINNIPLHKATRHYYIIK